MSNPMFNPQQNYSGVTIQIANPAVNVNPYGVNGNFPQGVMLRNGNYAACPQACYYEPGMNEQNGTINGIGKIPISQTGVSNPIMSENNSGVLPQTGNGYAQAYPAGYYINNYGADSAQNKQQNVQESFGSFADNMNNTIPKKTSSIEDRERAIDVNKPYITGENLNPASFDNDTSAGRNHTVDPNAGISPYKDYAKSYGPREPEDMTASKNIIGSLDERNAEIKEAKKNTKEAKIVALTDEYIMSLENYLNNENDEIRLMASKEILTRLDEDKDRYDDAALNALLNKMLQDPSKLVRLAALSAFASQLACGNDYTVQLLQNIQSNPNADKEDALQAADILLKMSAGVEVKNIPSSDVKREQYKMKQRKTD